jgi:twitching motility protein PilT
MSEHDLDQLTRELDALGAARADPTPETAADAEPDPVVSFADDLDAGAPAPVGTWADLHAWCRDVVARGGSDLLLVADAPPAARVHKHVVRLDGPVLDGPAIEARVLAVLPPHARRQYAEGGIADGSFAIDGVGRFRVNLHHERGRAAATVRVLPRQIPAFATLGLPAQVQGLAELSHGLVLVGGATGSGKTTTLAALVDTINRQHARHVITLEDPIEYVHRHKRSIVEQVEIGSDAPDYPTALRAALRQMPDVIVVGEMRDPESMQLAVTAAETGHLVIATLHTTDVTSTVARIADAFPPERQPTIRQEIAMALSAVLVQALLPREGGGLVPAVELLMVQYGARQHIRKNQLQHLHQEITVTRRHGSMTFEESLAALVRSGMVHADAAMQRAHHPEDLQRLLAPA